MQHTFKKKILKNSKTGMEPQETFIPNNPNSQKASASTLNYHYNNIYI